MLSVPDNHLPVSCSHIVIPAACADKAYGIKIGYLPGRGGIMYGTIDSRSHFGRIKDEKQAAHTVSRAIVPSVLCRPVIVVNRHIKGDCIMRIDTFDR